MTDPTPDLAALRALAKRRARTEEIFRETDVFGMQLNYIDDEIGHAVGPVLARLIELAELGAAWQAAEAALQAARDRGVGGGFPLSVTANAPLNEGYDRLAPPPEVRCVHCNDVIVYRHGDPVIHVGCSIADDEDEAQRVYRASHPAEGSAETP